MADNKTVEVLIDGKVYRMSGDNDTDYMRQVAAYINDKMQACRKLDIYRHLDLNTRAVLIHINIANELFATRGQISELQEQIADMGGQLYDVKHDLVTRELETETLKKQLAQLQEANKALRRQLAQQAEEADQTAEGKASPERTGSAEKKAPTLSETAAQKTASGRGNRH